ncbi:MAG: T9SS type A sorting domain-containing protein, partial [Bacteroidales bacterium]|nr:T9SS type A sorting domain-containing protein [Bacteroidales bacterium]
LLFQPNNASSAFLVGSSYYQNPIVVVVKANPLQADIYEPNNDHQSAYKLDVKFNQDKALLQTTGSNIHLGNDKDYYKIVLPEGYDYKFKAEVYDAYNFPKNQSYTCDVLFSYFTAKTDWSGVMDDKMNDSVLVENGGTVYFYVSPYSEGLTGTYQLNVAIRRISTSSINQIDNESFLTVYPNPAHEVLYIHAENTIESVKIYDRIGKEVMHSKVNDLQTSLHINHFPSGVYFIHIQTDKKTIRKFMKN